GPYSEGATWADPSGTEASRLMRFVYDNPDEASKRGTRAQRDIYEQYSENAVASLIERRLRVVAGRDAFHSLRRELQAFSHAYLRFVESVRIAVEGLTPPGSRILVVSRGDERLLSFSGREGWHFPRERDGTYSGYHPANSGSAIAQLEKLRGAGADFLLFPGTSRWWLEYYHGLRRYLNESSELVWDDEHIVLYRLVL